MYRKDKLIKLQLLLTVRYIQTSHHLHKSQPTLGDGIKRLLHQEEWDASLLPTHICPICQQESRLLDSGVFSCEDGHAFPHCLKTLELIADNKYLLCSMGCGPVKIADTSGSLGICCICNSPLIKNYL